MHNHSIAYMRSVAAKECVRVCRHAAVDVEGRRLRKTATRGDTMAPGASIQANIHHDDAVLHRPQPGWFQPSNRSLTRLALPAWRASGHACPRFSSLPASARGRWARQPTNGCSLTSSHCRTARWMRCTAQGSTASTTQTRLNVLRFMTASATARRRNQHLDTPVQRAAFVGVVAGHRPALSKAADRHGRRRQVDVARQS